MQCFKRNVMFQSERMFSHTAVERPRDDLILHVVAQQL